MFKAEWILCPCCGAKTKTKVMENTILENFPLFCPRCKHETIIQVMMVDFRLRIFLFS